MYISHCRIIFIILICSDSLKHLKNVSSLSCQIFIKSTYYIACTQETFKLSSFCLASIWPQLCLSYVFIINHIETKVKNVFVFPFQEFANMS